LAQDGDWLYHVGGRDTDGGEHLETLVARHNADGTLGPWSSTVPPEQLPDAGAATIVGGTLYLVGGGIDNDSWYAMLGVRAEGGLPWWGKTENPSPRTDFTLVLVPEILLAVGGLDADGNPSTSVEWTGQSEMGGW